MISTVLPLNQKGIVLLYVLWINALTAGLTIYLLSSSIVNIKSVAGGQMQAQQFEATEAGLLEGERQLEKQVSQLSSKDDKFIVLPSIRYGNYHITFNVLRLPQTFCIIPKRSKGYYYQLTATAESINLSQITTPLSLQSIIALSFNEPCKPSFIKRQEGRSAWCQLT